MIVVMQQGLEMRLCTTGMQCAYAQKLIYDLQGSSVGTSPPQTVAGSGSI